MYCSSLFVFLFIDFLFYKKCPLLQRLPRERMGKKRTWTWRKLGRLGRAQMGRSRQERQKKFQRHKVNFTSLPFYYYYHRFSCFLYSSFSFLLLSLPRFICRRERNKDIDRGNRRGSRGRTGRGEGRRRRFPRGTGIGGTGAGLRGREEDDLHEALRAAKGR